MTAHIHSPSYIAAPDDSNECWQSQLQHAVTDFDTLVNLLDLPPLKQVSPRAATKQFPLLVPQPYLARIKPGDWHDPLLRQVLPLGIECIAAPGYQPQPLAEHDYNPIPGLIHKYHSRVLLTVTRYCAINCRYCFRRHFDYASNQVKQSQWQQAIDYIGQRPEITEVIFSGGDPLIAPDNVLSNLSGRIASIPHVKYLRIHSRMPIVVPSRVDSSLLNWLASLPLKVSLVVHCNHPNEIDTAVSASFAKLRQVDVTLLNQAVLLRQVNDNIEVLEKLSYRLYDSGVLPYYLHMLDRVQGAAHFEVSLDTAKQLHLALLAKLPGYLVPRLVQEVPGAPYKVPIN